MSFSYRTEEYYQKFIELQEKLRKSEEERLKLEMKFTEMVQVTREEEQMHYRKLRSQYKKFLEEDRKRQDRNEKILHALERIETRLAMLSAKTDRFNLLRKQYQNYRQRVSKYHKSGYHGLEQKSSVDQCGRDLTNTPDTTNMYGHLAVMKPLHKKNDNYRLETYLQRLSNEKCDGIVKDDAKVREMVRFDVLPSSKEDSFSDVKDNVNEIQPNIAISIAEDIINSIYFKDRPGKQQECSNILEHTPSGDSYKASTKANFMLDNVELRDNFLRNTCNFSLSQDKNDSNPETDIQKITYESEFPKAVASNALETTICTENITGNINDESKYKIICPKIGNHFNNDYNLEEAKQIFSNICEPIQIVSEIQLSVRRNSNFEQIESNIPLTTKKYPADIKEVNYEPHEIEATAMNDHKEENLGEYQGNDEEMVEMRDSAKQQLPESVDEQVRNSSHSPEQQIVTENLEVTNEAHAKREYTDCTNIGGQESQLFAADVVNLLDSNATGDSNIGGQIYCGTDENNSVSKSMKLETYEESVEVQQQINEPKNQIVNFTSDTHSFNNEVLLIEQIKDDDQTSTAEHTADLKGSNENSSSANYESEIKVKSGESNVEISKSDCDTSNEILIKEKTYVGITHNSYAAGHISSLEIVHDENGQLVEGFDENNEPIISTSEKKMVADVTRIENKNRLEEESSENLPTESKEKSETKCNKDLEVNMQKTKEDVIECIKTDSEDEVGNAQKPVEDRDDCEKPCNVMGMLDTDTESATKQDSKISNDSDFDFSNSQ